MLSGSYFCFTDCRRPRFAPNVSLTDWSPSSCRPGEVEVLTITGEWLERTKNLPSPFDAYCVILRALPVGLDSDEIRRRTITKGSVVWWNAAEGPTELPNI